MHESKPITDNMPHQPGIVGPLAIEGELRAELAARAGQALGEVAPEAAPPQIELAD